MEYMPWILFACYVVGIVADVMDSRQTYKNMSLTRMALSAALWPVFFVVETFMFVQRLPRKRL